MIPAPSVLFVNIRWELRLTAGEAAIPDPIPARTTGKHNHGHLLWAGHGTVPPPGTGILPCPPKDSALERKLSQGRSWGLFLIYSMDLMETSGKQRGRIAVASRQRQEGSGIKLCLASVGRLKCFGSLRKCPFHFSIDWSLLNTHTSANAAFGGFSLGLFSFHFFHDFKCFWQ